MGKKIKVKKKLSYMKKNCVVFGGGLITVQ